MNKILYKIFFIAILGLSFNLSAQPPRPPGRDAKAPIDMGIALLLIAGSGLGISKIRKNKKDTF